MNDDTQPVTEAEILAAYYAAIAETPPCLTTRHGRPGADVAEDATHLEAH